MFLEALECHFFDRRHGRPGHRVEGLLLDRGVDRELLDDAVDDPAPLDERSWPRVLESLEQLLYRPVVVSQHRDGVHGGACTRQSCTQASGVAHR
jgi:hypothetical protein